VDGLVDVSSPLSFGGDMLAWGVEGCLSEDENFDLRNMKNANGKMLGKERKIEEIGVHH
jgi:hypothetical protein